MLTRYKIWFLLCPLMLGAADKTPYKKTVEKFVNVKRWQDVKAFADTFVLYNATSSYFTRDAYPISKLLYPGNTPVSKMLYAGYISRSAYHWSPDSSQGHELAPLKIKESFEGVCALTTPFIADNLYGTMTMRKVTHKEMQTIAALIRSRQAYIKLSYSNPDDLKKHLHEIPSML